MRSPSYEVILDPLLEKKYEALQKIIKEADALGYRPLQADVLYHLGNLLFKTGEYKASETTLYHAAKVAGNILFSNCV